MHSFALLLIALLGLSVVVVIPRTIIGGRRLFLFRVLFPSWRFFESIGVVSKLYFRVGDGTENGSQEWHSALQAPLRFWHHIFFNPYGNLYFAQQSAVEHLVSEIEDGLSPVENSVAYGLVREIALESVMRQAASPSGSFENPKCFQFKVSLLDESGAEEDLLLSPYFNISGAS